MTYELRQVCNAEIDHSATRKKNLTSDYKEITNRVLNYDNYTVVGTYNSLEEARKACEKCYYGAYVRNAFVGYTLEVDCAYIAEIDEDEQETGDYDGTSLLKDKIPSNWECDDDDEEEEEDEEC